MTTRLSIARSLTALLLLAATVSPGLAQDAASPQAQAEPSAPRTIRNAPPPRALELAAYIFAGSNVCGYPIGAPAFEALLAKQNVKPEDVALRGPFGTRIVSTFSLMSNDMAKHREESCLAVAGEYGPEGSVAKDVLLPPGTGSVQPVESAPAKPAQ